MAYTNIPSDQIMRDFGQQNHVAADMICSTISDLVTNINNMEKDTNDIYGLVRVVGREAQRYGPEGDMAVFSKLNWLYQGEKLGTNVRLMRNRIMMLYRVCNGQVDVTGYPHAPLPRGTEIL